MAHRGYDESSFARSVAEKIAGLGNPERIDPAN
jgi:hypothetical protein